VGFEPPSYIKSLRFFRLIILVLVIWGYTEKKDQLLKSNAFILRILFLK